MIYAELFFFMAMSVFTLSAARFVRLRRNSRSGKPLSAGRSSSSSTASGKIGEKLDYSKIARLEIEMFGETKLCDGSPYRPGFKTIAGAAGVKDEYGVDSSGHYYIDKKRRCNLNSQLGAVCRWSGNHPIRQAPPPIPRKIINDTKITYRPELPPNPYADWTDEDGRPW